MKKPSAADKCNAVAAEIFTGFQAYRADFQIITNGARARFENRDWAGVQRAGEERLTIYRSHLDSVVAAIATIMADVQLRAGLWRATKAAYLKLIANHYNAELFETFYNSAHREITGDSVVDDEQMFVTTRFSQPPFEPPQPLLKTYGGRCESLELVSTLLRDLCFDLRWQDLERDARSVLRSLSEECTEVRDSTGLQIDILPSVFYRNKGAYLIGRIRVAQGSVDHSWPLALPLLLDDSGCLYVDTMICDEDELSVMFSFTRSYFMVYTDYPHAVVDFLQSLLPNKKRAEIYASIGLHKHGKTVFYRDFLEHLGHSEDLFVIAPGIRGMVMSVFSLPSLQTVFKVIRDEFAPQKSITAREVREKYHVVKKHDRVGRMADTQEFENLAFPKGRIDPALLSELLDVAPSAITVRDNEVLVKHLYTERLMTPLNLYIDSADDKALKEALDEYGNAIKQLAAANIFPGDMLLKNFGVTRHGRVVFYDYDEICYLTDVNFRAVPQATTVEEEMAAEPWYSVGAADVFPEEFRHFLFGRPRIKQLFDEMHGELFDPGYWIRLQQAIKNGQVMDVFPYRRKKRFAYDQSAARS